MCGWTLLAAVLATIFLLLYSKWTSQYNASEVFTLYSETSNMSYTFIYKYNNCVDVRLRARLSNTHTQNSRAERKLLLCRLHKVVHIIHACGHECCEIIRYFILLNQCFVFAHTRASLSFCQLDLLRASQWPPGFCVRDQLKTFFTYHTSFSLCLSLVVQKENNFPYGVNIKYFRSYKSSCKYSEYS